MYTLPVRGGGIVLGPAPQFTMILRRPRSNSPEDVVSTAVSLCSDIEFIQYFM